MTSITLETVKGLSRMLLPWGNFISFGFGAINASSLSVSELPGLTSILKFATPSVEVALDINFFDHVFRLRILSHPEIFIASSGLISTY